MSTTEVVCTQGDVISQGLSTIARAVTSDLLISQDLSIPCKARWLQARIHLYKRISLEQVWRYDIWTSASRDRAATATSGGALVGRPGKRVPTSDNNSLVCHCTIQARKLTGNSFCISSSAVSRASLSIASVLSNRCMPMCACMYTYR